MSKLFSGVRQIGYIVKNIDEAVEFWSTKMGVGPWFVRRNTQAEVYEYYGKPMQAPKLDMAFANSGDMQIELIQQLDNAPSLYLDSMNQSGEIAQHVAYWTADNYDEWRGSMLEKGFTVGHEGEMTKGRGRFCYLVHNDCPSLMVEISEAIAGKAKFFEEIRTAAENWDGELQVVRV